MNTRVFIKVMTSVDGVGASGAIRRGHVSYQHSQAVNILLETIQANELPHRVIGNQVDWVAQDDLCTIEHDLERRAVPMSLLTKKERESLSIGQFFETGVSCLPETNRFCQAKRGSLQRPCLGAYAGGFAWLGRQGIGPVHDTGISWRQEVGR